MLLVPVCRELAAGRWHPDVSDRPPPCRIVSDDVAIHWFPTYEDGVPCGCGAVTCTVERDDDEPSSTG